MKKTILTSLLLLTACQSTNDTANNFDFDFELDGKKFVQVQGGKHVIKYVSTDEEGTPLLDSENVSMVYRYVKDAPIAKYKSKEKKPKQKWLSDIADSVSKKIVKEASHYDIRSINDYIYSLNDTYIYSRNKNGSYCSTKSFPVVGDKGLYGYNIFSHCASNSYDVAQEKVASLISESFSALPASGIPWEITDK